MVHDHLLTEGMTMLRLLFLTIPHRLAYGFFWLCGSPLALIPLAFVLHAELSEPPPQNDWFPALLTWGIGMFVSRRIAAMLRPQTKRGIRLFPGKSTTPYYQLKIMPAAKGCAQGTADYRTCLHSLPPALQQLMQRGLAERFSASSEMPHRVSRRNTLVDISS